MPLESFGDWNKKRWQPIINLEGKKSGARKSFDFALHSSYYCFYYFILYSSLSLSFHLRGRCRVIDYQGTVTAAVFLNSPTFLPSALEDDTRSLPRLPPRREPIITVDANIMQIGVASATGFGSTRLLSIDNFLLFRNSNLKCSFGVKWFQLIISLWIIFFFQRLFRTYLQTHLFYMRENFMYSHFSAKGANIIFSL